MMKLSAESVHVFADYDHGEGWLAIHWRHDLYGGDTLSIGFDGWCSRRMPIRSGQGPPEYVELTRDRLRLRFAPDLAKKLELDEEVEISFSASDEEFDELRRWVDF